MSELESQGWVRRLEQRLTGDDELRRGLEQAHDDYIAERARTAGGSDDGEWPDRIGRRGIGGIADRRHLKCLHLHVAHALARTNPIGNVVLRMLPRAECAPTQEICSSLLGERSRSKVNR